MLLANFALVTAKVWIAIDRRQAIPLLSSCYFFIGKFPIGSSFHILAKFSLLLRLSTKSKEYAVPIYLQILGTERLSSKEYTRNSVAFLQHFQPESF